MRVSYNWLRELLPDLNIDPKDVGEKLTAVGLELDAQTVFGAASNQIKICAVQHLEPHPSRDKLRLVTVDTGAGSQRVVCGASNVPPPGGLVALAPLGTTLPAIGLTLTPKNLGGIVSEGMLCSEVELGLAQESAGILTFEAGQFKPGTLLSDAIPASQDTIFELGITPNRPDALGHVGVARDLAAAFALPFTPPRVGSPKPARVVPLAELVSIENQAPTRCPRYGAAVVQGVSIGPSPHWVRWRLYSLGIRPISNVVDVTNWVLLEYGNPMHAFDLERVRGRKIVIRTAKPNETMRTLDGASRELVPEDLVIADAEAPSALAGVMGGADSEIKPSTQNVLLECAYFEPGGVRKTARRLGLHSDSSYRFERGVNWANLDEVLQRAQGLLCELAGGTAIVERKFADGTLPTLPEVRLRKTQMERLLGRTMDFAAACTTLQRLGFEPVQREPESAVFRAPAFRPDISLEADLIEEVARIDGLQHVPETLPRILPQPPTAAGRLERSVRTWAAGAGLSEAMCYSFVSPQELKALRAPEPTVSLQNPLSTERSVLTTSLLVGLVDALQRARRHGESNVRLFAVGSRFVDVLRQLPSATTQAARPRALEDVEGLVEERLSFACVLAGERAGYLSKAQPLDVYDAKGLAVQLVQRLLGVEPEIRWAGAAPSPVPHLHPRGAAQLWVRERCVGSFGPLHPDVIDDLELGGNVLSVEIDLTELEQLPPKPTARYQPIPRLPAVTRDIAVEAAPELSAGQLLQTIRQSAGSLCESVELFDLFQAEGMQGRRSLAFRIVYRDPKASTDPDHAKTLTDKEVDAHHEQVLKAVLQLGAVPRT